jgi:hypothetical protein
MLFHQYMLLFWCWLLGHTVSLLCFIRVQKFSWFNHSSAVDIFLRNLFSKSWYLCEIWGFRGDENVDCGLLGCDTVCLTGGYQYFRGCIISILYLEDGADTFLQNVGQHLQDYMASQPRRPLCSCYICASLTERDQNSQSVSTSGKMIIIKNYYFISWIFKLWICGYEDGYLLGRCIKKSGRYWPMFHRGLLPASSSWWCW